MIILYTISRCSANFVIFFSYFFLLPKWKLLVLFYSFRIYISRLYFSTVQHLCASCDSRTRLNAYSIHDNFYELRVYSIDLKPRSNTFSYILFMKLYHKNVNNNNLENFPKKKKYHNKYIVVNHNAFIQNRRKYFYHKKLFSTKRRTTTTKNPSKIWDKRACNMYSVHTKLNRNFWTLFADQVSIGAYRFVKWKQNKKTLNTFDLDRK